MHLQFCFQKVISMQLHEARLLAVKRMIRGYFHHFSSAKEKPQGKKGVSEFTCHVFIQDVQTRWNSSYYILKRLLEQERAFNAALWRLKYQHSSNCCHHQIVCTESGPQPRIRWGNNHTVFLKEAKVSYRWYSYCDFPGKMLTLGGGARKAKL